MKNVILFGGCLGMFLLFAGLSVAGSGPETMDLKDVFEVEGKKRAVIFPHHKHQAKVECASCHINPKGGGSVKFKFVKTTGVANDYHKNFCWPCHIAMKVPKGKSCSTCHTGPK